ncbi:MAG: RusA family crossover junction endodeoxyribonuclease [Lacibacter sp.]
MSENKSNDDFFVNPFYDGVMLFMFNKPVPPKQTKGKKQNRKFEEYLRNHLLKVKQDKWPVKGKVMVFISVTGSQEWIENIDVDNISKSVLDSIKNIVIEDDSSVYALFADKRLVLNKSGLLIGIKKINGHNDYFESVIPPYYVDKRQAKKNANNWWLIFNDSNNPNSF